MEQQTQIQKERKLLQSLFEKKKKKSTSGGAGVLTVSNRTLGLYLLEVCRVRSPCILNHVVESSHEFFKIKAINFELGQFP